MSWLDKLRRRDRLSELDAQIEEAKAEQEEVIKMRARTDRIERRLASDRFGAQMEAAFRAARRERPV
jgi:hypothetical protein